MATTTTANGVAAETPRRAFVRAWWIWAALAILALLPFIGGKTGLISNYSFLQLVLMIVYAIAVLGLILLTGFNGQISLGHGAFFAVGAYTAAILIDQANWPYWATLPVAAICALSWAICSAYRRCGSKVTTWRSPRLRSPSPCHSC